ncbi:hypothetical protein [Legionella fairfieldensis]|uniref:hypothetical protein n=1 Tax=Legionella fairfieldensis TaxID=45064 RepID=UPI00048C4B65|nr:hypothetical protein [Legionella fairfieldensis]
MNKWGIEYELEKESTQFDENDLTQNRNELNQAYYAYDEYREEHTDPTPVKSDYFDNQTVFNR